MKNGILFSLLFFVSAMLLGQEKVTLNYYLPDNIQYNPNIPTPESVIGHEVGEWHVSHDKLVSYMKAIATASDRITIEDRGKTYEGRSLLLLTITSPENHRNIERIRNEHIKLTENGSAALNTQNMPVVVYQGLSIHGNESSGSNAGLAFVYYLAAAQGTEIEALLKDTVILLDPSLNPDGLQRFAYWANTNKSDNLNPDNNDREYHEVWPGGRTNHYWFDMNRDWLPVQLPESRVRIASFHKWLPNILTDHHEMGTNSTFFFQPGEPDRVHPLTPKVNQELTAEIAKYHVSALDKIGSLYFSGERFDDYYYGKGSTFPDVNGSIGILFEQGSSRGHIQESENGLITFPFTIRNQFTAMLSTIEAAKNLRVTLLNYQRDFYNDARNKIAREKTKAIVFGDEKDAAKTYHLAEILNRHKIKFHHLKNDFSSEGKRYKKGYSYIVPTNQKNSQLIKAMFEKRTTFKDSLFYDISAWTFPLAFNLDYTTLNTLNNAGEEITNLNAPEGSISGKSTYAYLFEWHEYYTPKALYKILKKEVRAKMGPLQFSLNGKKYDYGTIMIPVQNQTLNAEELHAFLKEVALETHIHITAVSTGYTEKGIDLGSNDFTTVELPKVAMLVGNGISPYDAGEIWHVFDQRYDMHITKIDQSYFNRVDLDKYNVFILPASFGGLNSGVKRKLQDWVKKGGTLIGFRNAVNWLRTNDFLKAESKSNDLTAKNVSFEARQRFNGAQVTGGAIFEARIDRSHPINFGYKNNTIPLFRNTNIYLKPEKQSYNNPIVYTSSPLLSGYVSEENLELLKNSAPLKSQRLGRGRVIGFTDNTNFRAFWYGTNKLMMNAVFFGKMM